MHERTADGTHLGSPYQTSTLFRTRPHNPDGVWHMLYELPEHLRPRVLERVLACMDWGVVQQGDWDGLRQLVERLVLTVEDDAEMADSLAGWELQAIAGTQDAVVYYIRFADRIKIGTTTHLKNRLASLPFDEVLALEPGGRLHEAVRHRQFAHLRVTGEWFRAEPDLLEFIEGLNRNVA